MENGLYPTMLCSLTNATTAINALVSGHKLSDEQWETYANSAQILVDNLFHINRMINVPYTFEGGLPHDIINYHQLLVKHNANIEELVAYLLDRGDMFGDTYKYETMFLMEALDGATYHADIIAGLVSS